MEQAACVAGSRDRELVCFCSVLRPPSTEKCHLSCQLSRTSIEFEFHKIPQNFTKSSQFSKRFLPLQGAQSAGHQKDYKQGRLEIVDSTICTQIPALQRAERSQVSTLALHTLQAVADISCKMKADA